VRISALEGRRVAIWGLGREGRAALTLLRSRLPAQALTVFCSVEESASLQGDAAITVCVDAPDVDTLAAFEIVIKSPGISPYHAPAPEAAVRGVQFTSGTALWFAEWQSWPDRPKVAVITGSKGKSTTTALVTHLLRAGGHRVLLAGNIGLPLLETIDDLAKADFCVIELSSYQAGDALRPDVALLLNLYPEHLDWHGSVDAYYDDKCRLLTQADPRVALAPLHSPDVAARVGQVAGLRDLSQQAWHVHAGRIVRNGQPVLDCADLPLPGAHNARNLCAALAVIDALGVNATDLLPAVRTFRPLPHRLQTLGDAEGIRCVNDSISTTPHASLAALAHFAESTVALLVGGYDRGLDWSDFVVAMGQQPSRAIIGIGAQGARIIDALHAAAVKAELHSVADLPAAVAVGRHCLARAPVNRERVLLLSPGAPSFGAYRDYAERGRHFAALNGFDPTRTGQIDGLGLA
jgi:UDP-N-acetylmuramoylalanine--D-glutamate ligase